LKKILVTGGAGYIGSVLVELLVCRGFQPFVLDNLSEGHLASLPAGTPTVVADLQDRQAVEDVFAQDKMDAVVHLAALTVTSDSVSQPLRYYRENVSGMINLLLAMRGAGVRTMVFSSSAAVYGIPDQSPLTEKSPVRPISPFGWSKLMAEQVLGDAAAAHGLHWAVLRYFNAAGATARCGEWREQQVNLIPRLLEVAEGRRPHVEIHGTQYDTPDGTCVRDYLHVLDVAEAHLLALRNAGKAGGIFNLGAARGYSVREVIEAAERVTGKKIPAKEHPPRPGDPATLAAGHERIRAELGWQPKYSLEDMIKTAWAWRKTHPEGYGPRQEQ
jgi:UDP-glucose 4-epimerase